MANPLLRLAEAYVPTWCKKKQVEVLFRITADALESPMPETSRLGYKGLLQSYAAFTSDEVLRLKEGEGFDAAKQRLYDEAYALGQKLRRLLRVGDSDAYRLVALLYKNIEIEIQGSIPGELTVPRCFFSDTYIPEVCEFMSALDNGIIGGICNGGELVFNERITEGSCCCKAVFTA